MRLQGRARVAEASASCSGGGEALARAGDARVVSVNVGRPTEILWHGRRVRTAIWKTPVDGPVVARGVNLVGDVQADRTAHGGPDKALYAYAAEDLAWWSAQLDLELGPGSMGENVTTSGIDLADVVVGECWQVGGVRLQVTQPRIPCFKLGVRMADDRFPERFAASHRYGFYLRILAEGELEAGDEIVVAERPAHRFLAADVARIFYDQHLRAQELLRVPELPRSWHRWANRMLRVADPEGPAERRAPSLGRARGRPEASEPTEASDERGGQVPEPASCVPPDGAAGERPGGAERRAGWR